MRIFLAGARPAFQVNATRSLEERFTCTGANTGNQVIAYGLLQTIAYDEVSWAPIGPAEVNERFDHLVIAAANFLYEGFDFGWLADFLDGVRLPVTIAGLGAQSSSFDSDVTLPAGTERMLAILAERCVRIGVRGDYTADVLARRGIHNVQVIGCPSYYADLGNPMPATLPPWRDDMALAVNGSRDVIRHAFDPEAMRTTIRRLMTLAREHDALFVAQTERPEMVIAEGWNPDLTPFLDEIYALYGSGSDRAAFDAWARGNMRVFWDVPKWIDAMRSRDFVIGTRFHGAIAAQMAGTPYMVVCHDTRTTEMCRFLGMPHCDLATFNATPVEDLYARIDLEKLKLQSQDRLDNYLNFVRDNNLKLSFSLAQQVLCG